MNDTPAATPRALRKRFSTLNVLLALTVLSVTFGAAVPALESRRLGERVDATLRLSDRVQEACRRHRDDAGILAIEVAAADAGAAETTASFHRLAMHQSYAGWQGPYLDHPLSLAENPFGGGLHLRSDWGQIADLGFDLDRAGFGQFLVLEGVPEGSARQIDERIDHSGVSATTLSVWQRHGRVAWTPDGDGRLLIDLEVELDR